MRIPEVNNEIIPSLVQSDVANGRVDDVYGLMDYPSFIGSRYIRSKKKRTISAITAIAISGVAVGVILLSIAISIASGFEDEFTKKVLGVNTHVLIMKYGMDFREYRDVIKTVEKVPGVKAAEPFVIQEMMISKGNRTAGILLKGVDPYAVSKVLDLPSHIVDGNMEGLRIKGAAPPKNPWDEPSKRVLLEKQIDEMLEEKSQNLSAENESSDTESNSPETHPSKKVDPVADNSAENREATQPSSPLPGIIIGQTLAENLDTKVGDVIQVTTPIIGLDVLGWAPSNDTPRHMNFKVTGIFYAGFLEYDTKLVFVDYYQAQRFFNHGDSVTGVELTIRDINAAGVISKRIKKVLGDVPYRIIDWQKLNESLFAALKTQKLVITIVLAVIIGVAAFNIIATLVMMVFDKRKEIAILKSMGATHIGILRIFMHVGLVVGVVGIAIGLLIGFGICFLLAEVGWPLDPEVYLIDHLPVTLNWMNFLITCGVAFLICIFATILPSLSASTLRPVDGMRQG